ncbi:MAG TPA: oligosaccharide flippase family protein, partial [Dyella sp.]|uniref:lipopolysaccharide biosynthesis protein n=1 Tax=Dyella sp. TaxID=1869338 RepID=UPI002D7706F2
MARMGVGRLGRNAILSTIGLGVRAVIQAGYLLVLSHWMGAKGYGLFAGSVSAAILISPLSGWGVTFVLTRRVAVDPSQSPRIWATAVLQLLATGLVLIVLLMLGTYLFLKGGIGVWPMLLLGGAELIALPLAQAATGLCIALDRGVPAALSMCLVPLFRLLLVLAGLLLGMSGTPGHVSWLHFAGSLAGALLAYGLATIVGGAPQWGNRPRLGEVVGDGSRYAVGTLVSNSYLEVDKVLLLQVLGAAATGAYTAAFRVMSVFALPVAALIGATLPRLFAQSGTPQG